VPVPTRGAGDGRQIYANLARSPGTCPAKARCIGRCAGRCCCTLAVGPGRRAADIGSPGTVGESRPEEPSWPWAGTQQFVPASLSAGCAVQPFLWYCLGVGRSFLLFFGGFTPDEEAEIELMLWPVFLTTRPRCSAILVSTRKRR
jgi:hypothetical protein